MERAWLVLKMPFYDTPVENLRFLTDGPRIASRGGFVPKEGVGGNIEQMTPNDFIAMTPPISDKPFEKLNEMPGGSFYPDMFAEQNRITVGMPFIHIDDEGKEQDHEGRHRMQALIEMGHGEKKFPVMVHRGGKRKHISEYGQE